MAAAPGASFLGNQRLAFVYDGSVFVGDYAQVVLIVLEPICQPGVMNLFQIAVNAVNEYKSVNQGIDYSCGANVFEQEVTAPGMAA